MSDVFSKEKRSQIMQRVHSNGNKSTEKALINLFNKYQITGWKRHYDVKGHPDFVFHYQKIAVFVDGCFWHGHECRNIKPRQNKEYWDQKRERNRLHDLEITKRFEKRGWKVIRIWECELKKKNEINVYNKFAEVLGVEKR